MAADTEARRATCAACGSDGCPGVDAVDFCPQWQAAEQREGYLTTTLAADSRALLERGRYALTEFPDGHWEIVRAGPLCETCSGCGCGEQQEPIMIPAMVARVITGQSQPPALLQKMLGMIGG